MFDLGSIAVSELSPERLFLDSNRISEPDENIQRHVARYKFASHFIPHGATVLDCACGSGYGTPFLSERASEVIGVDSSAEAIAFANQHYASAQRKFECKDICHLNYGKETFDAVVSIETLEHIPQAVCIDYLTHITAWVKPGGIFLASSPMLRFKEGKPFVTNPYHINEMPREKLLDLLHTLFSNFALSFYHQKQEAFLPLLDENTGFCIVLGRKRERRA